MKNDKALHNILLIHSDITELPKKYRLIQREKATSLKLRERPIPTGIEHVV